MLAKNFRRLQSNYSVRNFLIILTGDQLLSHHWPPEAWTERGGKFASAGKIRGDNIVDGISDITQQLFLDMEPLDAHIRREVEKEVTGKISKLKYQLIHPPKLKRPVKRLHNKPQGAARHFPVPLRCFAQMAFRGVPVIRIELRAARTTQRSTSACPQLILITCCGHAFRGYSTPLHACPRIAGQPRKATSPSGNVGAPSQARHFFLGASPGVARPNQPPLSSVAVERVTLD